MPALKNLTIVTLLKRLSDVYKTMHVNKFLELAPKLDGGILSIERLVMAAIQSNQLKLRWDHRTNLLHFTDTGMESKIMREHLFTLAQNLQQVRKNINKRSYSCPL